MITAAFLAMITLTLLAGARLAVWMYSDNSRARRDANICREAERAEGDQ